MSIPGDASPLLLGGGAQQYKIERSIRLNAPDSVFLSRTPASAGNRRTWTWSGWVKRSAITSADFSLFSAYVDNNTRDFFDFASSGSGFTPDCLRYYTISGGSTTALLATTQVFRDCSAWYHIVILRDTTQAEASNRVKIFVNGAQITSFGTANYPSQNLDSAINNAVIHDIGDQFFNSRSSYFSGYLADIHFIDGQALTPSSFAETNTSTGQWVPKAYTGTYGTNGFRLAFADNSNNTATTLGKDSSPNGNNWTPNNLSVTAGAGNDSLVDTPTSYGTDTGAGGEVRGNYCTWNPLDKASTITLANGNLEASGTSLSSLCRSTIAMPLSGKWYMEFVPDVNGLDDIIGVARLDASTSDYLGNSALGWGFQLNISSITYKYNGGSAVALAGSAFSSGDVGMLAVDIDNSKLWLGRNGVWYESGSPSTGANAQFLNLPTSSQLCFAVTVGRSGSGGMSANFGQRQWAYAAPAGFKALCDTNLPAPVVAKPNTVMDVLLYSGNGSSPRSITGLGFNPDFVWIKERNTGAYFHRLFDANRGASNSLYLPGTDAENTYSSGYANVTSFDSSGFTLTGLDGGNNSSVTYVAWTWDAGTSTVTNTQGSITSQVRANASAGFSVITYTGNNNNGSATVGHGLGVAPQFIIAKKRSGASNWMVGHRATTQPGNLRLNTTDQLITSFVTNAIGSSNSSTFLIYSYNNGVLADNLNDNGATYVAYCWAPVAGYSSFGSYTGNGNATDGPFVFCGFRPRWLLLKNTNQVANWYLVDAARNTYNVVNSLLRPNLLNAELSGVVPVDFLSNGFKIRDNDAGSNASGETIVWAAFAESPFQYARAR